MTHSGGKPHTNIGDLGQRFEVRARGWPNRDWSPIGWSDSLGAAQRFSDSIALAPGWVEGEIYDRLLGKVVEVDRGR